MGSRREKKDLEATLVMAEVKLACLLVDHRDHPEMQRLLARQRDSLLTLRRRLQADASGGLAATLRRWLSPRAAVRRLRRIFAATATRPV